MRRVLLLVPLFAIGVACGVTETGNPQTVDTELFMRAASSQPDVVDVDAPAGIDGVDGAWLSIERVRFVRGAVCEAPGELEIDVPGPFVTDATDLAQEAIRAELPSDDYCRVRVRTERASSVGSAPAELADHTVLLTGTRADGTPWMLRSRRTFDVDVRSTQPIPLDQAAARLEVTMDVAQWLRNVDLDSAVVGAGGGIVIDEDNNDSLLDAFEDAFEDALELFDISDDD